MPKTNLIDSRGLELAGELAGLLAPARVSTRAPDRLAYARDLWPRGLLGLRSGEFAPHPPDVIVWPETVDEVAEVVRHCRARGVPIVPYGAGSGVCGGAVPLHGGVIVDMKRMRRLLWLDRTHLLARFEAGIVGEHLEHTLNQKGLTLGHFPSSIMCSTLGGWLATRSAGQCSTRYGKIEDLVRGLEVVTGSGERLTLGAQPLTGPDITQLMVGSEGTLGLITAAELAVRPLAPVRILRGFSFARLEAGCDAMRRVMQRGLRPFVLRLYDELDTFIAGRSHSPGSTSATAGNLLTELRDLVAAAAPQAQQSGLLDAAFAALTGPDSAVRRAGRGLKRFLTTVALSQSELAGRVIDPLLAEMGTGCQLIVGVEGEPGLAQAEWQAVARELVAAGGRDLGPEPAERWLARRYAVSFNLSKMFDAGAFADTMEVAVPWERLLPLYHAVRRAVAPHAFVMAHFSHAYADGCSIYFTFAAAAPGGSASRLTAERRYDAMWQAGLSAALKEGATLSHHHGVGLLKAPYMPEEHGAGMYVLSALKTLLDPDGIMNPGKLGLSAAVLPPGTPAPAVAAASPSPAAPPAPDALSTRAADAAPHLHVQTLAELEHALVTAQRNQWSVAIGGAHNHPLPGRCGIDLSGLSRVLAIDETSLLVHVEAGATLSALEVVLGQRNLTLPPMLPSSRGRQVGALLAAPHPAEACPRARLIDHCAALQVAVLHGETVRLLTTRLAPRKAAGPDWAHVFLGARGQTGVITSAWLRALPQGEDQGDVGFVFADAQAALACGRAALDTGVQPAALAVLDEVAAAGLVAAAAGGAVLLVHLDGAAALVAAEAAQLGELARRYGGREHDGRVPGSGVARWLRHLPPEPPYQRYVTPVALDAAWAVRAPGSWVWGLSARGAAILSPEPWPPETAASPEHTLIQALVRRLDPDQRFHTNHRLPTG